MILLCISDFMVLRLLVKKMAAKLFISLAKVVADMKYFTGVCLSTGGWGHAWQEGMRGRSVCLQGRWPLKRVVCILLQYRSILVATRSRSKSTAIDKYVSRLILCLNSVANPGFPREGAPTFQGDANIRC